MMRDLINIVENTGQSFTVFHGGETAFDPTHIDPARGAFFSGDVEYARGYGPVVTKCEVTLSNPLIYSEEDANGEMEIDREVLINQGYDGRVIQYDNGEIDVIAFYPNQIMVVDRGDLTETTRTVEARIRALLRKYPSGDFPFTAFGIHKLETGLPREIRDEIRNGDYDQERIETVDIDRLVAQDQNGVGVRNLRSVLAQGLRINELPELLLLPNGEYWVVEGHHRICVQILNGATAIKAKIYSRA
jgi:hypothetical protein